MSFYNSYDFVNNSTQNNATKLNEILKALQNLFSSFAVDFNTYATQSLQFINGSVSPKDYKNVAQSCCLYSFANDLYLIRKDGTFFKLGSGGGTGSGDGIKFVKTNTNTIQGDSNRSIQLSSTDSSIAVNGNQNSVDFSINTSTLANKLIDFTKGLDILNNKIIVKLSGDPNNLAKFDGNGAIFVDGSGIQSSGVKKVNQLLPDGTGNIQVSSSDNTLRINNSGSTIDLSVRPVDNNKLDTINSVQADSAKNINLVSSNQTVNFKTDVANSVNLSVNSSQLANGSEGITSNNNNLALKLDPKPSNRISVSQAGVLVEQAQSTDIQSINNIKADPSSNYNLSLTSTDNSTGALTVGSNSQFNINLGLDISKMVSTEVDNDLTVAGDNRLYVSTKSPTGRSLLQALSDGTTVINGSGANRQILFKSSDGTVQFSASNDPTNGSVMDVTSQQATSEDFSYEDTIYISSTGDDSTGDGSYKKPYRSLTSALSALNASIDKDNVMLLNTNNSAFTFSQVDNNIQYNLQRYTCICLPDVIFSKPITLNLDIQPTNNNATFVLEVDKIVSGFKLIIDTTNQSQNISSFNIKIKAREIQLDSNSSPLIEFTSSTNNKIAFISASISAYKWNESLVNATTTGVGIVDLNNYGNQFILKLAIENLIDNTNRPPTLYPIFDNQPATASSKATMITQSIDIINRSIYDFSTIALLSPQLIKSDVLRANQSLILPNSQSTNLNQSIYYNSTTKELEFVDNSGSVKELISQSNIPITISKDANNIITQGSDSKLFADLDNITSNIKINNEPFVSSNYNITSTGNTLALTSQAGSTNLEVNEQNIISADKNNELRIGSDNKLFVPLQGSSGTIKSINSLDPDASGNYTITGSNQITTAPNSQNNGIELSLDANNLISSDPDNIITSQNNVLKVSKNNIVSTINSVAPQNGDIQLTSNGGGIGISTDPNVQNAVALRVNTSQSIGVDSGSNQVIAKLSQQSDNILKLETDGLYVKASTGQKFLKTINTIAGDGNDNLNITSSKQSISLTTGTNAIDLDVALANIISSDANNTIKLGADGKLASDTGSSTAGINTINNIQPDASKNFNIKTLNAQTPIVINAETAGVSLDLPSSNLVSADANNELKVSPNDKKLFVKTDTAFIRSLNGVTATEDPDVNLVSKVISYNKSTTTAGEIDTSLIFDQSTSALFSQATGLKFNLSQQAGNILSIKNDGLYSTATLKAVDSINSLTGAVNIGASDSSIDVSTSGQNILLKNNISANADNELQLAGDGLYVKASSAVSNIYKSTIWLDTVSGDDVNSGNTISKAVKNIDIAITKAKALKMNEIWIRTVPLNSTQQLNKSITIDDSRINLDLDLDITGTVSYSTAIHSDLFVKIKSLTGKLTFSGINANVLVNIEIDRFTNRSDFLISNVDEPSAAYIDVKSKVIGSEKLINMTNKIVNMRSSFIAVDYNSTTDFICDNAKSSLEIRAGGTDNG